MLDLLFSCLRFLGRKRIPLRGAANWDGVFWQLIMERGRTDPGLNNWLKRRDNWMSNNIQYQILRLFAHDIQRQMGAKASQSPLLA